MQIFGIQDNSASAISSTPHQNQSKSASSFGSYLAAASDSDDNAVQEFMDYAKETPAQRMFSNWLGSHNITQQQFDAMTPAQQQALVDQFKQQMEQSLDGKSLAAVNAATTPVTV